MKVYTHKTTDGEYLDYLSIFTFAGERLVEVVAIGVVPSPGETVLIDGKEFVIYKMVHDLKNRTLTYELR